MAEATVTVRAKAGGKTSSAVVRKFTYGTDLGWSVGGGTVAGYQRQATAYGSPSAVRIFSPPSSGIKPWTRDILAAIPRDAILIYSIKDWPIDVYGWMSSRPSTLTTPYYFCLDHEPEGGPAKGDPTPAQYQQEWRELIDQVKNHPRRSEMRLAPIFTEYYAKKNAATFWADFGVVASYSGVDAIGFDIYDLAYSTYRTPADRLTVPLQYARRSEVRKPLIVAEWGIDDKGAVLNPGGTVAAKQMRDTMAHIRKQSDIPYVTWWHDDYNALWDRPAEQQALKDLIALNP